MSKASESDTLRIAGVRLTHPERVLYPAQGITKRELAEYYERVAEWILPHLRGRPLTLVRCPRGREGECFVQRRADEGFPASLKRVEVPEAEGSATYLVVESLPGLIALAQMGVLELHTWGARRDRLERPDRLVLDLDPDPGLPWARVAEAAHTARERLLALGLRSFVKTTGGKGLHLVAPLVRRSSWDEVREAARGVAEGMARAEPALYLAQASKDERGGRIYVDYLRNAWSASAVAAYSPRARPGAPVSVPLAWEELDEPLDPKSFTVRTVPARLRALPRDPWEGYGRLRQRLTRAALATARGG